MKKIVAFFVVSILAFSVYGQEYSTTNKKAIKAYEVGLQYFQMFYYDKAEESLLSAIKQDETFTEAYYLLAGVYNQTKDTTQMLATLQTCVDKCGGKQLWSRYKLAYEQYNLGLYKEAFANLQHFKRANEMHTASTLSKADETNFNDLYEKTATALELQAHPVNFTPVNLGQSINTKYDDYHPTITIDDKTIIFTTNLPTSNPQVKQEDLFTATKNETAWDKSAPLTSINTKTNEGAQSITADGKTMFFTICGAPDGLGSCDIYMTKKVNNTWIKPQNLGQPLNSKYWESQPSCSSDGKTLYFTSNRPGGIGKKDIWISHQQANGQWSTPENLGEIINTKYDDESPYVHPDGITLYYATDGIPGMGKEDIVASQQIGNSIWTKPQNLGYPINTNDDESHLIINAEGTKGYFASNRYGGFGGFDLYEFSIDETFKVKPNSVTYVMCRVFDFDSKAKLAADITLSDLETGKVVYQNSSDVIKGECVVPFIENRDYALSVEKQGYLLYSENVSLNTIKDANNLSIPLQQINVGNFVVLKNIFFDTDSYNLKQESKTELLSLVKFMQQNPTIHFEIGGHTDNVGKPAYNLALSTNRAKAVYEFLIANGIDANRLTYKGFGDTKPCVANDTEEHKAQNRRTQLSITKK